MPMMTPTQVIQRIAEVAEAVGCQAGVPGCETAGVIVSYLSIHPDEIGSFMADGIMALPVDLWAHGRLTFYRKDGKIGTPQDARIARQVRDLAKPIG